MGTGTDEPPGRAELVVYPEDPAPALASITLALPASEALTLTDNRLNRIFLRMFSESNRFPPPITPVVAFLLLSNILVFFLMRQGGTAFVQHGALWPVLPSDHEIARHYGRLYLFKPWQILTYGWLHGNLNHILVNLFAVWMFGRTIEAVWGARRFLVYYLTCVVGAGLIQLAVCTLAARNGDIYPTVGASGGVFGLLLAFGMMFPNARIMLLFPPIPMKAKFFVIGYGALELFLGISGTQSGVAHFAHLGGMLFGFVLILLWKKSRDHRLYSNDRMP